MQRPMKTLARGVAPLLGALAIAIFAALGPPGDAAAEGLFLARMAAGLLAAASWVAPRAVDGALASVLTVAAAFLLPAGPPRGATVVALLCGALALAVWRRARAGGAGALAQVAAPLAIGIQFLLRSDLLLGTPTRASALTLLVLPLVAGAGIVWLGARHGARAWIAAAALLAVGPGWNLTTTVALLAVAAASFLAGAPAVAAPDATPALPSRGVALAAPRILALLVLLAPLAGNWRAGLLSLAAAMTLFLDLHLDRAGAPAWRLARVVLPALVLAAVFALVPHPVGNLRLVLLALPLLPAAVLSAGLGSARGLAAAFLAVAGADALGGSSALAPAVALGALAALGDPARERWLAYAQAAWSGLLLGAVALCAAYPWLRPEPLRAALALFGAEPTTAGAVGLLLPVALLAFGLVLAGERRRWLALWSAAAIAIVFAALAAHGAGRRTPLVATELVLVGETEQHLALPAGTVGRRLIVDSALLDGAALPFGTPVAEVALEHAGGSVERLTLRAGSDTGEWAARRADLRAAGLAAAPEAWVSWVAGTAPPIFGQRYRARFALSIDGALQSVVVRRAATLPPEARVVIYDLEIVE